MMYTNTCDTSDTQSHLDTSRQVMSSYWHKHGFERSIVHNEPHHLNIKEDKIHLTAQHKKRIFKNINKWYRTLTL